MLDGVDEIDWAALDGPYRSPDEQDIAGHLRALLSTDPDEATNAFHLLIPVVMRDSCVYPVTVAMMPFLVEVCLHAVHDRAELLWWTGSLVNDVEAFFVEQTRATFRPHAATLVPLLDDPDPEVRAATAFVLRQAGDVYPAEALWQHWASETDPQVRTSLLFALVQRDPQRAEAVARQALESGSPDDRLAAALALYRRGLQPASDTVPLITAAVRDGGTVHEEWCHDLDTTVSDIEDDAAQLDDRLPPWRVPDNPP